LCLAVSGLLRKFYDHIYSLHIADASARQNILNRRESVTRGGSISCIFSAFVKVKILLTSPSLELADEIIQDLPPVIKIGRKKSTAVALWLKTN